MKNFVFLILVVLLVNFRKPKKWGHLDEISLSERLLKLEDGQNFQKFELFFQISDLNISLHVSSNHGKLYILKVQVE